MGVALLVMIELRLKHLDVDGDEREREREERRLGERRSGGILSPIPVEESVGCGRFFFKLSE